MSNGGWKGFERAVAKIFKTRRVGPTGRFGPDVVTELFSVECRNRKAIPWTKVEEWAEEVRRESVAGTVPVLAIKRSAGSGRRTPTLFVLDEQAWIDLHGEGVDDGDGFTAERDRESVLQNPDFIDAIGFPVRGAGVPLRVDPSGRVAGGTQTRA